MDIYGPMFRNLVMPAWEGGVRRRPVLRHLRSLERTQWASLDELHASQSRALRALLRHAYDHVPFYRQRFLTAGLVPSDLRGPEDLHALPIVRRADLQGRVDTRSTAGPTPTIAKQTSGTSGEPFRFGYEAASEHWRRAVKLRGYGWAGYQSGDRALHFWGARLPSPPPWATRAKVALDRALHREHYLACDQLSDDRLREAVDAIRTLAPTALVCYAQAGAELARFINRQGLRTWPTISVICGAEKLMPRDRADLEAAFGPAVFDTYGCREVMMIGAECEAHRGLHISMENLVVEIVVTENGRTRPARDGETGEVVLTDLHNYAMPFIRYANGDIARAGGMKPCVCGRTLPRITAVEGRATDTMRDGRGAAVHGLAISFLFHDLADAVQQFQAIQHKDRSVSINLVLARMLPDGALEEIRRHAAQMLEGVNVGVNVVPTLPRNAAGKHQLVVVER